MSDQTPYWKHRALEAEAKAAALQLRIDEALKQTGPVQRWDYGDAYSEWLVHDGDGQYVAYADYERLALRLDAVCGKYDDLRKRFAEEVIINGTHELMNSDTPHLDAMQNEKEHG